jgi:cysteinyl-tRNA synthetase
MLQDFLNDLDTPRAMLKLRAVEKDLEFQDQERAYVFERVDALFGLKLLALPEKELSEELIELLEQRISARGAKDFARSDELRDLLLEKGIEVRDTSTGQSWKWIKF